MLRVVLADDEVHIRNLLKYLIHWDELGLQLIADYGDGKEVIEHAGKDRPDLIISDIKMPGMDGLEMIRQAKAILPECRFIIVSGFRDFEFAKQAVKLGVNDYILKPVDGDELNSTLCEMIQSISGTKQEEPRDLKRQDFLPVLKGQSLPGVIGDVNRRYGFRFAENGIFYVLCLQICRRPKHMTAADYARRFLQGLTDFIKSYLIDWEAFPVSGQTYAVLLQTAGNEETSFLLALDVAYHDVLDDVKPNAAPMTFYLSCGRGVRDISEIHESYESSQFFVSGRFGYGETRVYIADTQTNAASWLRESYPLSNEMMQRFRKTVENRDEAGAQKIAEEAFRSYENADEQNWALFLYISAQLADGMTQVLNNLGVTTSKAMNLRNDIAELNENSDTIEQLITDIQKLISLVMHQYINDSQDDSHTVVRYAKDYIDKHYADDISLALLAEKISINPTYLSAVFKETTGVNYSTYLTAVRIEHAKELLRNIDMNLSEIASAVGYNSTRYFTRIFTQEIGIKPSEYRRMNLRKINW